jgi:hypothetical protein
MSAETVTVGRVTYEVTATGDEHTPYELRGPRGAHYGLMRNVPNPHMLFTFNMKGFTRGAPDIWFTDRNGTLEWVR